MNYKVWKMMECALFTSVFAFLGAACTNQKEQEPEDEVLPKNTVIKPDSAYRYNIASNGTETLDQITYYSYDKVGNCICQLDSSLEEKEIDTPLQKLEMSYDAKSNLIEREYATYFSHEGSWHKGPWEVLTYDSDDKLAQLKYYTHYTDTTQFQPFKKGIFTWKNKTFTECLVYTLYVGSTEWELTEKVEYTYNEHGDIVKSVSYDYRYDESGKLRYVQDYSYDKYYNVISHVIKEEDVIILQEYNKYEYDDAGNILVRWYSSSSSETLPASPTTKYVYFY